MQLSGTAQATLGTTTGSTVVRIARLTGGGYVTSWVFHSPSAAADSPYQACFHRLDASGGPVGPASCVPGSATALNATGVDPIPRADGGFVLAWLNASDSAVRSQAFDAAGNAVGGIQAGAQRPVGPGAAALAGGGYVTVAMQPGGQYTSASMISFQRYASDGTPVGAPTSVGDSGGFYATKVVPLTGGGFVVAWLQGGSSAAVTTRMFTADGTPLGSPVVASTVAPVCSNNVCHFQVLSGLAPMDDGGYVVAWTAGWGLGMPDGTFARRFQPDGTPGAAIAKLDDGVDGASLAPQGPDGFMLAWQKGPQAYPGLTDIDVRPVDATALR
ncbi:hypothetical protein JJB11_13235 [Ramlibacter ginsenosidimutans]|uniref:Uncharacterized protein n=1 Tax=Ramlibacter ginsenosidimutans TaxID=502333 RepID=A0A934TTC8_9BURK|nr:hypothetical protein [Ramlibacter ginsenosidimutans]MBK6007059.1 hypothetical protein [Ramlibacter ginsenosidimutans]